MQASRPSMEGRKMKLAANESNRNGISAMAPKPLDGKFSSLAEQEALAAVENSHELAAPERSNTPIGSIDRSLSENIQKTNSIRSGGKIGSYAEKDVVNMPIPKHTITQSQEFAERATLNYQVSELERDADKDFFMSLSTTLVKEVKKAPFKDDAHPLMLAVAADNNRISATARDKSHTSACPSSVDVQMILEELGSLESVTQVYARDSYGRTPVHLAAMNGCADTIYQLMNTYRKSMYRKGVLDNVARLERERAISEAELRAALIASGRYTPHSWDLKVKRMRELALQVGKPEAGRGSSIPQLVAVQHWFEQEVDRMQRAHEIRVEVYRTKILCMKDKFGRTPLHYACASGCPVAVLEALLNCSTANLGGSAAMHERFNYRHADSAYDLGMSSSGPSSASLSQRRRWFSPGVIYESATGMEIGRTDGTATIQSATTPRTKESLRLINKSLRNVAWELTHEQSASGPPNVKSAKLPLQPGQKPGEETLQPIMRQDGEPPSFADDQERMYEVIVPWLCRNLLARAADSAARDKKLRADADNSKKKDSLEDKVVAVSTANGYTESSDADTHSKLSQLIMQSQYLHENPFCRKAGYEEEDMKRVSSLLVVPEVTKLLTSVGIQVTQAVIQELCRRYPADISACNDKWKIIRNVAKQRKLHAADSKSNFTGGAASESRKANVGADGKEFKSHTSDELPGADKTSASRLIEHDANVDADAKDTRNTTAEIDSKGRVSNAPDRRKLDEVLACFDDAMYDTDQGLDVDFFLRELQNGRAVQSIDKMRKSAKDFSDTGTGNAYISGTDGKLNKGIEKFCEGDSKRIAELRELLEDSVGVAGTGPVITAMSLLTQLSCCVSVSSLVQVRKQLVNLTDSYGRTPLLIAAANGHKELVETLLAHGGDTSIPALYQSSSNNITGGYRYNALSLAATGSIRGILEKALLTWLNSASIDAYSRVGGSSSSDVGDILASLANGNKSQQHSLRESKAVFAVENKAVRPGIGLGLNDAYLSTGDEHLLYEDTAAALATKSRLVLGMREHLEMLRSKNWAYSRCPLSWAVNNGLAEVVRCLLSERTDPNEADTTGRTALHEAAALISHGSDSLAEAALSCAELLLQAQADPNRCSVSGRSPLHELFLRGQDGATSTFGTITVGQGTENRMKMCFKVVDNQSSSKRLLRTRYKRRFLRLLLQFGGNSQQLDRSGLAPVHYAARENDAGGVLEMLRYDSAPSASSGSGSLRSSKEGDITNGSDHGSREGKFPSGAAYVRTARTSQTPLHVACRAGAVSVIQLLCRWEADSALRRQSLWSNPTTTHSLVGIVDTQGKVAAQYLPVSVPSAALDTLWGLAFAGNAAILGTLLASLQSSGLDLADDPDELSDDDNGAVNDVNDTNDAADPTVVGYVADSHELEHRTQRHAVEPSGEAARTPADDEYGILQKKQQQRLRQAARRHTATAHEPWLVDGINAKSRRLRWTSVHACVAGWVRAAAIAGNTSARRAVQGAKSKIDDVSSSTKRASSSGQGNHQGTLQLLLQNRAYVDGADRLCRTPLMLAAAANLEPAIALLLAAGADVFAQDLDGNTAVHFAYAYGSASAVATLEGKMGDNAQAKNHNGQSPLDMAGDLKSARAVFG